jgi:hypothetical protein
MREIFINYRRIDTMEAGGHLYADLSRMFGKSAVFMDSRGRNVPWGADWDRALKDGLENCEVLVALIGPQWTFCERSPGIRALDVPDDWVRNEIATALRRSKKVLPVLIRRDQPPPESELPTELKELGFQFKEAYPISETYWEDETEQLVNALKEVPKLKQLYDLSTGERGIRLLAQLIRQNARVADAVSRSRVVIEATDRGVDEIRLLKNIHDALHEIESKSLIPIRSELQWLASNAKIGETVTIKALTSARRKFDQQARDIETLRGEVTAVVPNLNVLLEIDLPQHLQSAAAAFDKATKTQRSLDLDRLVSALEELGSEIPVRLNDGIERAMRQLELVQLLDLMTAVAGLLDPAAAANRELKPMLAGIAALKDLRSDLALRVRAHGLLQGLDNMLRRMFAGEYRVGTWEEADFEGLSVNWSSVQRLRVRFTAPFSPVFQDRKRDLEDLETGIEAAFKRGDRAIDILALLNDYSNEIGELFREADGELKEFCAELREKTQPLKAILEQVAPEPQNA